MRSTARCAYPAEASFSKGFPVFLTTNRANNIAKDLGSASHASQPPSGSFSRRRGNDLRDGLSEAGHADRLAGFAHLFEDAEALGLELRDGDLFHVFFYTMVNDYGQCELKHASREGTTSRYPVVRSRS